MKYQYIMIILFSIALYSGTLYEFDNEADEIRFNNLIHDIRCPKCTSGSLASSNAPISEDLKLKIAEMINIKKTDSEIKEYVVSRFGKESLYEPQLNKDTFILWFSPFLILFCSLFFFFLRKKT